jgi:hypothetical protein
MWNNKIGLMGIAMTKSQVLTCKFNAVTALRVMEADWSNE